MSDAIDADQVPQHARAQRREVAVDGLVNIRDLGGLSTADGRVVRRRRLYRSDNLSGLTAAGRESLLARGGIRLVIDLRTAEECRREGAVDLSDFGHIAYINMALEPQAALNAEQIASGRATNLVDDYAAHLRVSGAILLRALELLADRDYLPAVVHCTVGKDRTGILVALLLELVGVERAQIADDYAATAPAMDLVLDRIRASPFFRSNGLASAPAWIFEANAETMVGFLEHLDERYGGAEQWGLERGMDPTLPARLRTAYLQESSGA